MAKRSAGPDDRELGQAIIRARKETDLTQAAVAERLGISAQQYSKYERGTNRISYTRLSELADLLPTLPQYLPAGTLTVAGFGERPSTAYTADDSGSPIGNIDAKLRRLAPDTRDMVLKLIEKLLKSK